MVMLMHSRTLQFIIEELTDSKGAVCVASRNKYACRVIQRLLEYSSPSQVVYLVEDLLSDVVANCCDRYCKYVMQCLLDHGTVPQVRQLMRCLAENARQIAVDVNGCCVVGKAMSAGLREDQVRIGDAITSVQGLLKRMPASQGHFVAKNIQSQSTVVDLRGQEKKPSAPIDADGSLAGKTSRRGRGGGVAAQHEAEARDLLESLRAACT